LLHIKIRLREPTPAEAVVLSETVETTRWIRPETLKKQRPPTESSVRREHPAIERKISERVRRHGARRARYWGQTRVLLQQLLTGWVVNIKRTVRLLTEPQEPLAGTLRAEVAASG
jgi:hypothetical protein